MLNDQRFPKDLDIETSFDQGGFIVCHSRRFMFVVIAKNASTTLKRLVYEFDYPGMDPITDTEEIHEFFGYSQCGKSRAPLVDGPKYHALGYLRFAVYRDPVERFLSVYYDKVSPRRDKSKTVRKYFSFRSVIDVDIDTFIDFAQEELAKEVPLYQDEHLRRQTAFYEPSCVDFIVPIEWLDLFLFEELGIGTRGAFNKSKNDAVTKLNALQKSRVESIYDQDYVLLQAKNAYLPKRR